MLALATFALAPSALRVPIGARTASVRCCTTEEREIPFDIYFLRSAKVALRRALQEDGGALDEELRVRGVLACGA